MNWTTAQRARKARGRLGLPLPVLACQYREHDKSRRSGPLTPVKQMVRELRSRPRSLAPMLRFQFSFAFIGPDGLARFGGLFQWGLQSGWGQAICSG